MPDFPHRTAVIHKIGCLIHDRRHPSGIVVWPGYFRRTGLSTKIQTTAITTRAIAC